MSREQQAADNRLLMPECHAVIADFKAAFGDEQVMTVYVQENGMQLGIEHYGEAMPS